MNANPYGDGTASVQIINFLKEQKNVWKSYKTSFRLSKIN